MKKNYIFALVTVLIWAMMATVIKVLLSDIPNLQALAISGVFAFLFLLLLKERMTLLKGVAMVCSFLGVVTDAVAYLLWALALKGVEDTAKIANLAYLTPFLSVLISAVFLKEEIKVQALVALVLIIGGILLQNVCERKWEKSEAGK